MNWVTTNIRLPEDLYMELKMSAAKERKSVAAVIREKLTGKSSAAELPLLKRLHQVAGNIAKENKGINFTQGVISMRYEQ